ncbi:hypothetical protein HDU87_003451 [Geranomyces variabilis]|uniref:Uncharacterized protein n=1 Tax=Geranomyces variabilis TaxID=109894 RepID=A0AAD5TKT8_9FUNG|nr:hypothetical protein HDU87_003451 [Geranomyces variabilis]
MGKQLIVFAQKQSSKSSSRRESNRDEEEVRRSAITGKKLKMKVHKDSEDKAREINRNQLLQHLNHMYD